MSSAVVVPSPVVSVSWLKQHLKRVKVLDCSWYLPNQHRDCQQEFFKQHIPTAQFFDLDQHSLPDTSLPHMFPTPEHFERIAQQFDISNMDTVIVYDTHGCFSAPRVWYTLKLFGHQQTAVLNGGLIAWHSAGERVESGESKFNAASSSNASFKAHMNEWMVMSLAGVKANCQSPSFILLDARPAGRFNGTQPEPRPGLDSGHIPHSINIPFTALLNTDEVTKLTKMKEKDELLRVFASFGVNPLDENRRFVVSCGTGVTASIIALALEVCGYKRLSLYDGSWTEYVQQPDTIKLKSKN